MKTMTLIGKAFAMSNDTEQADILNELAYALKYICDCNRSGYGVDMQLCHIVDKLDVHGIEFIEGLADFIKRRKEANAEGK